MQDCQRAMEGILAYFIVRIFVDNVLIISNGFFNIPYYVHWSLEGFALLEDNIDNEYQYGRLQ